MGVAGIEDGFENCRNVQAGGVLQSRAKLTLISFLTSEPNCTLKGVNSLLEADCDCSEIMLRDHAD